MKRLHVEYLELINDNYVSCGMSVTLKCVLMKYFICNFYQAGVNWKLLKLFENRNVRSYLTTYFEMECNLKQKCRAFITSS